MAKPNLTIPELTPKQINRFWNYVSRQNVDECWHWTGPTQRRGYGRMSVGKRTLKAHRLAYFLHYNQWPGSLLVCHSCDNPSCVNPHHLWLGTTKDNLQDAARKGRILKGDLWRTINRTTRRGSHNGHAILTEAQVQEIRQKFANNEATRRQLAEMYQICPASIDRIINRKQWKHI